jgi:hypothetical protein
MVQYRETGRKLLYLATHNNNSVVEELVSGVTLSLCTVS